MLTTVLVNFNHAHYLSKALESILTQVHPADELIVIDDVSNDNSVEIISSFLPRHPNARLIRNPKNQGCVANMNDGLNMAQGDVIHFAAADDVFYPSHYRTGVDMLNTYPGAAFFSSRSDVVDEAGTKITRPIPQPGLPSQEPKYIPSDAVARILMRDDGWFMGNTAIFRRDALLAVGGFPANLDAFSDGYVCRILALTHGVCFSPETLAAWRKLPVGIAASFTKDIDKSLDKLKFIERKMVETSAFPRSYPKRWLRRQVYDVHRRRLSTHQIENDAVGTPRVANVLRQKIKTLYLLLRWRPWDILPSLQQYIANIASGRR